MKRQDYLEGLIEGVLSCYLATVIDEEGFWYTVDSFIYSSHKETIEILKSFPNDFLDSEKLNKLMMESDEIMGYQTKAEV